MGENKIMKTKKDLLIYLKEKGLRMTPLKEVLVDFFIHNKGRQIPFKELQEHTTKKLPEIDRTTLYRNTEKLISLDVIQELNLPKTGKVYQFVYNCKIQHYFICKKCDQVTKGDQELFHTIELALKQVHGFANANMSAVFYGYCSNCEHD